MRYKKYLVFLTFILLIASVSAITTTVNLKTMPHKTVIITPISTSGGFTALSTPISGFSGEYGDIKFEFEIDESYFDLNIIVKDGDTTLHREKLRESFVAGLEINTRSAPETFVYLEKPNETEIVKEEIIETIENITNETEQNLTLTISHPNSFKNIISNGYEVIKEKKLLVFPLYYFLLGLTALILIFLTVRKNHSKLRLPRSKNKIKLPENENDYDKAKRELKEAQQKVKDLKQKRLEEVERRLEQDKKELKKLRGHTKKNKNFSKKYEENKKKSIAKTKAPEKEKTNEFYD